MFGTLLCCPESCCDGAVEVQVSMPPRGRPTLESVKKSFGRFEEYRNAELLAYPAYDNQLVEELPIIKKAAERNNCIGDNFFILLAIRKAENGSPGREFGILHPRCLAEIRRRPNCSLSIQAGWAAATIVKNRLRWMAAKSPGEFIGWLADRYCPPSEDLEGNRNWKRNVKYFYEKFKNERAEN